MNNSGSKIIAFIGDGEGKTSAAIGHAIRAAGHDKKVAIIQFLKGKNTCGEYKYIKNNSRIDIFLAGEPSFFFKDSNKETHTKKAKDGVALATKIISSKEYFLVVLDEIFDAAAAGLISNNDILDLINNTKSEDAQAHLILTGRILPPELSTKIDLVTQMKKIKHYYDRGEKGIEGLDY